MSFYSQIGELILGTRLKRISERFLIDISKIYKSQNIPFEPSWFSIFYLLDQNKQMSIGEIAAKLDISHSGVSQMITVLLKKGMVEYAPNGNDKRVRLIRFTKLGYSILDQIKPIWHSIKKTLQETLNERENSTYLLPALDEFEEAMEEKSIYSRIMNDLKRRKFEDVHFVPFSERYLTSYKTLLFEWFTDNDSIEIADSDLVNNPQNFIQAEKGVIYLAVAQEKNIGIVIAKYCSKSMAEIFVFILDDNWRRTKIGEKILCDLLHKLGEIGKKEVQLTINRKRIWELKLFKNAGFNLHALSPKQNTDSFGNIKLVLKKELYS